MFLILNQGLKKKNNNKSKSQYNNLELCSEKIKVPKKDYVKVTSPIYKDTEEWIDSSFLHDTQRQRKIIVDYVYKKQPNPDGFQKLPEKQQKEWNNWMLLIFVLIAVNLI